MEAAKKNRKIQRSIFTKSLNDFNVLCENVNSSHQEKINSLQILKDKMDGLEAVNLFS